MPFDLTVRAACCARRLVASSRARLTRASCRRRRAQTGRFVPEKSNIWRDCVDGYYDWVKEHIAEVRPRPHWRCVRSADATPRRVRPRPRRTAHQGAPLNEPDHCGDPPLLLAAGNGARRAGRGAALAARRAAVSSTSHRLPRRAGHLACVKLLIEEGADIQQAGAVRIASVRSGKACSPLTQLTLSTDERHPSAARRAQRPPADGHVPGGAGRGPEHRRPGAFIQWSTTGTLFCVLSGVVVV